MTRGWAFFSARQPHRSYSIPERLRHDAATGNWLTHEIALFQLLWEHLRPGDILLGDRGFGSWTTLAQCRMLGLEGVFRLHGARKLDWRKGQRLSRDERLVQWLKPVLRPRYLSSEQWAQFPPMLTLRLVRCRMRSPGFRTQEVILVTTLLDRAKYPVPALSALYLRRWDMEITLRHLKHPGAPRLSR